MDEATRIVSNCCTNAHVNGHTTAAVVDEILDRFSNPVMCYGHLREIIFTPVTASTFKYHTVDWYEKIYGRG